MPSAGAFFPYQVWLEGEDRAELQAIARTAKHRLQRGIWTSPGAGQRLRVIMQHSRIDQGAS